MKLQRAIPPTVILLVLSVGMFGSVEAKTVEAGDATASWNGTGVIDDLGFGERVFAGTMTGTMFIRHPEGSGHALIHAAKIDCQAIIRFSEDREETQTALCIMTAHEGKDVAHAELRCTGKKDECKGQFTFTWGSGGFKGITGSTPFVGGINIEQKKDGRIYGYAAWPKLMYSLP